MSWQVETDWLYPFVVAPHNKAMTRSIFRWHWTAWLYARALHIIPIGPRTIGIPLQSRLSPTPERAGRE